MTLAPQQDRILRLTLLLLGFVLLGATPPRASAEPITVPVDLGIGPAGHMFTGPLGDDQRFHWGLRLDLNAIIDKAMIKKHQKRVPKKYRKMALKMDEFRYKPLWWLPDTIMLSPKLDRTSMWGLTWRPLSLGIPLVKNPVRLSIGAGLIATYLFIQSEGLESAMHFLRPGLDLRAELILPVTSNFKLGFGWTSQFYIPQEVGPGLKGVGEWTEDTIWHVGQWFAQAHFLFPYTVNL
jgi:hypothetical protein